MVERPVRTDVFTPCGAGVDQLMSKGSMVGCYIPSYGCAVRACGAFTVHISGR